VHNDPWVAQALIKPYPAEAHIDPGAEIIDPTEADIAFQELYGAWLKERFRDETDDGIAAALVLADQGGGLRLVEQVAISSDTTATPSPRVRRGQSTW
jgi:exodeoxyribonuclease-5